MPFPKKAKPQGSQFKLRVTAADLKKIEEMSKGTVHLPARTITAGGNKSELVRQALGLAGPEKPVSAKEPGKTALGELMNRVAKT